MKQLLSFVIPCYHSAETLPAVVEEFAATGRWLLAATIAMGVALFFVYDVLLGRLMARWPAKI